MRHEFTVTITTSAGTAAPLVAGMLLTEAFFPGRLIPDGLSAGIALAPTSVGRTATHTVHCPHRALPSVHC